MNQIKNVYLSNISEDVWAFIDSLPAKVKQNEIEENAFLSDRALFTLEPNTLFISNKSISCQFLDYACSLINLDPIEIVTPDSHEGRLSLQIMNDQKLVDRLVHLGKQNGINLRAYSSTTEFYQLAEFLNKKVKVNLPFSPTYNHRNTVDLFGSKGGIRGLVEKQPLSSGLKMAPGKIFTDKKEAINYASELISASQGVVIKTNRGHAGMGIVIIPPGKIDLNRKKEDQIEKLIGFDQYWDMFPVIVEKFIDVDPNIGGGFPNLEYLIMPDGDLNLLYSCGMRVTNGVFSGVEIGPEAISPIVLEKMLTIGNNLGILYSKAGYRGYFDIDFAAGRDGNLYITESNLRQTGGSHVYHLAKQLLGSDYPNQTYLISDNTFKLPAGEWTLAKIFKILKPLLYSVAKKSGIVVVSENMLARGQLSYVAIGKNRKDTNKLVSDMISRLN